MPEVTVLLASYNPRIEKLKTCLKSVMLQRDISTQIVITDDGSRDNQFDKIEAFFGKYGYTDYKLIANDENRGTVKNMISGLSYCTGDYIKPISPDDYLYGEYALRHMVSYADKQKADAVMCGSVYYCDDDGFKLLSSKALPQHPEVYKKSRLIKNIIQPCKKYKADLEKIKDNNINNNIVNKNNTNKLVLEQVPEEYGDKEINRLFNEWEKVCGLKINAKVKMNRYACKRLIKSHGFENVLKIIPLVAEAQSDQYAPGINNFMDLCDKWNNLAIWYKKKMITKKKKSIIVV